MGALTGSGRLVYIWDVGFGRDWSMSVIACMEAAQAASYTGNGQGRGIGVAAEFEVSWVVEKVFVGRFCMANIP